jgi:NAD(P)-dependent dehydrogenase (short-subunit alcohol dehydrogenase family)
VLARVNITVILPHPGGLVILTTFTQGQLYPGNVFYDVAKNAVCRMARGLAQELADYDIAVVALSRGWMLVERMTRLSDQERAQTESVECIGRAVAATVTIVHGVRLLRGGLLRRPAIARRRRSLDGRLGQARKEVSR